MEPREYWDRNSLLAEAFCACDEQVREAQALLDERQIERSRTLAAFAVTVGNDATVATLMGLGEREVRLARRTVGKTDARDVAQELLSHSAQGKHRDTGEDPGAGVLQPPAEAAAPPALDQGATTPPPPQDSPPEPEVPASSALPHQRKEGLPPASGTKASGELDAESGVTWSASMDSVLVWSWRSNLDLRTVAAELGLDMRSLLLRTQTLAAEGRLGMDYNPVPEAALDDESQSGRHRRHYTEGYATFANTTPFPAYG